MSEKAIDIAETLAKPIATLSLFIFIFSFLFVLIYDLFCL